MKLLSLIVFCITFKVFAVASHISKTTETGFQTLSLTNSTLKQIGDFITRDFPISTKQLELGEKVHLILKQQQVKDIQLTKCMNHLDEMVDGIRSRNINIQRMVDATGKAGSGLLSGKLQFWGDFDQCSGIYVPSNSSKGDFHAQYCRLDLWRFGNLTYPVRWGFCIPDSCDGPLLKNEIFNILNSTEEFFPHLEKDIVTSIEEAKVECHHPGSTKFDYAQCTFICVLVVMLVPCLLGCIITYIRLLTGKELYESSKIEDTTDQHVEEGNVEKFQLEVLEDKKGGHIFVVFLNSILNRIPVGVQKFFQCFCPILNTMGLFQVKASNDQVQCLDGIRTLACCWVILCHTFGYLLPVLGNTLETANRVENFAFQIIINGFYSVDIFFVLSGFLLAWQFLKRKGELNFFSTIFHRLVRLFPIYAIVTGFQTLLFHLLGSGPIWPIDGRECTGYWWTNLIFLNNFIYSDHQCMVWAWYMASDFQYFVVSLLILCVLEKGYPHYGLTVAGLVGVGSVVYSFVVTYMYNLITGPANNVNLYKENPSLMNAKFGEYFLTLYVHPCGRYHVFAVGMFLAYLFNRKEGMKRALTERWSKIIFYVGAIFAAIILWFCIYGLNAFGQGLSTLPASFYNALHHLLFSLSFAWFVYYCAFGKLGFFNRILSARILVPLSRLTYSAYLLHPILMEAHYLSSRAPFQYSHLGLVILNFGFVFVTYMIALVVTILFGAPFINLERYLRQHSETAVRN